MTDARKIDAEVAQAIFGWWKCGPACESDELWHIKGAGFRLEREMPHYSTNIADAMAVLEKATAIRILSGLPQSGYEVSIWFIRNGETSFGRARSDSLPMAICLCALRAVGAERKDCGVQQKEHTGHKEKNE